MTPPLEYSRLADIAFENKNLQDKKQGTTLSNAFIEEPGTDTWCPHEFTRHVREGSSLQDPPNKGFILSAVQNDASFFCPFPRQERFHHEIGDFQ